MVLRVSACHPVGVTSDRERGPMTGRERRSLRRDAALVERLRAGDRVAFSAVVTDYSPMMRHVARGYVASTTAADDVVQEAWLTVIRSLETFEGRSALRTWIVGIVVNIARRHGAKDARPSPWAPERRALDAETLGLLGAALATLPESQRLVVTLRDVDGLSGEEVCAALGLTAGNQRILLHRGRARLRQELEDYYRGNEVRR